MPQPHSFSLCWQRGFFITGAQILPKKCCFLNVFQTVDEGKRSWVRKGREEGAVEGELWCWAIGQALLLLGGDEGGKGEFPLGKREIFQLSQGRMEGLALLLVLCQT